MVSEQISTLHIVTFSLLEEVCEYDDYDKIFKARNYDIGGTNITVFYDQDGNELFSEAIDVPISEGERIEPNTTFSVNIEYLDVITCLKW